MLILLVDRVSLSVLKFLLSFIAPESIKRHINLREVSTKHEQKIEPERHHTLQSNMVYLI